jgi:S-formylglutathione hydrolase FrmB
MSAWETVKSDLDDMIASGAIKPIIAIMPDFSANNGASYYVDSAFEGKASLPAGEKVESAFFSDLIPYVDAHYNTILERNGRAVAGYSMGGYGAIRYSLAHSDFFRSAIILSPAVYNPLPPADSSTREFGAFGSGQTLFDENVYEARNYPALFSSFPSTGNKLSWFIAVGDGEIPPSSAAESDLCIDVQSALLNGKARYVKNLSSELRVLNGGHSWDVWRPGFIEGAKTVFALLDSPTANSTRIPDPPASDNPAFFRMVATAGDDLAGGLAVDSSGNIYEAAGVSGAAEGQVALGDMDILVQKVDAAGNRKWAVQFGTALKDCPCSLGVDGLGHVYVAGYTKGALDPALSASNGGDDCFVAKLSQETGEILWKAQVGSTLADRIYGMAVNRSTSEIYVAGYTKGLLSGASNAGDKDAFVAKLDADGKVIWKDQFGSSGEDKAWSVALSPDGSRVWVSGVASGQVGSDAALGGSDCFLACYAADGARAWLRQFGTTANEEAYAVAISPDGQPYIAGYTTGGFAGSASPVEKDIIVASFDSKGAIAWKDQFGSSGASECTERGAGIAFSPSGRFYVSAFSDGEFQTGRAQGALDAVIFRYEADKTRSCLAQFGGPGIDAASAYYEPNQYLAVSADGVYMSGCSLGDFIDASHQGTSDTGDVFLVKYGL